MDLKQLLQKANSSGSKFQCPMCPYATQTKGRCRDHLLTHTGERPHACPRCGRRFTQKSTMRRHAVKNCYKVASSPFPS